MSFFVSDFVSANVYFSLSVFLRMLENLLAGQRDIAITSFFGRVFCVTNEENFWS